MQQVALKQRVVQVWCVAVALGALVEPSPSTRVVARSQEGVGLAAVIQVSSLVQLHALQQELVASLKAPF